MEVRVEFLAKSTIKIWAYTYDESDTLSDPTSVKITIYSPTGTTLVDGSAMTKSETGKYYYYYRTTASSARGFYPCQVEVVDGSGEIAITSIEPFGFRLR